MPPAQPFQPARGGHLSRIAVRALWALLLAVSLVLHRCVRGLCVVLRAVSPASAPPTHLPPPKVVHPQRFGVGGMRRRQAGARRLPRVGHLASVLRCVTCIPCG